MTCTASGGHSALSTNCPATHCGATAGRTLLALHLLDPEVVRAAVVCPLCAVVTRCTPFSLQNPYAQSDRAKCYLACCCCRQALLAHPAYPQVQFMDFLKEAAYGIIILAFMQQQKPGIAWCHIGCDKQVVEPVYRLQASTCVHKHAAVRIGPTRACSRRCYTTCAHMVHTRLLQLWIASQAAHCIEQVKSPCRACC